MKELLLKLNSNFLFHFLIVVKNKWKYKWILLSKWKKFNNKNNIYIKEEKDDEYFLCPKEELYKIKEIHFILKGDENDIYISILMIYSHVQNLITNVNY